MPRNINCTWSSVVKAIVVYLAGAGAGLWGQSLMPPSANGSVVLLQGDYSALESREERRDLPCSVSAKKTELGFDLRMHAGYDVAVTLDGNPTPDLVVITRVRNLDAADQEPIHLRQRILIPEGWQSGEGAFTGEFEVGAGKYGVDFLMRDRAGRYCTAFWEFQVQPPAKSAIALRLGPGQIQPLRDSFSDEPPAVTADGGVAMKVLVNYEPAKQDALLGMLRAISRDPRVKSVSLAMFNLEQRQVLVKQAQVDFPALRTALKEFQPGVIDAQVLASKEGGVDQFLTSLVDAPELGSADAVVFLGSPVEVNERLADNWSQRGNRMFYLRYHPNPWQTAWTDSIERAVQLARGRKYAIQQPKDLLFAWGDIVARLLGKER